MWRVFFGSALAFVIATASAEEWTGVRSISALRFDGQTGNKTVYFETPSAWGAAGCPNAKYVFVRGVEGLKELLAIGMAAKLSGTNVSFVGTCQDADYFLAYYIYME